MKNIKQKRFSESQRQYIENLKNEHNKEILNLYNKNEKHTILLCLFFCLAIIGATLNIIPLMNNGGRMPVYTHINIDDNTHFSFIEKDSVNNYILTDIFDIKTKNFIINFSIGDVIILITTLYSIIIIKITIIDYKMHKKIKNKIKIKNY